MVSIATLQQAPNDRRQIGRAATRIAHGGLALAVALAAVVLGASRAAAQAPAAPPAAPPAAELFFRQAEMPLVRLSPSGRYVAALVSSAARPRNGLIVIEPGAGKPPKVVAAYSDIDVFDFEWVGDDWLVYRVDDSQRAPGDGRVGGGLYSVPRDGGRARQLVLPYSSEGTMRSQGAREGLTPNHGLLMVPSGRGTEVIIGEYDVDNRRDMTHVKLLRLDVTNGQTREATSGLHAAVNAWHLLPDGTAAAAEAYDRGTVRIHWRDKDSGRWRQIAEHPVLDRPWRPSFVNAGHELFVLTPSGPNGEDELRRFDLAANRPEDRKLVTVEGFDFVGGPIVDASGRMLGVRFNADAEGTEWFDPRLRQLQADADRRLPGRINRLSCRPCAGDDTTVLVFSYAAGDPGSWWLMRGQPAQWARIGVVRPALAGVPMGSMDFVRVKARDGLEIPVWVTLPAGHVKGQPRAAVVLVHGGPWLRGSHWHWNATAQFLASRGYAVIEPEFRGSTGFGSKHLRAGDRQWGRAMQDDVADATQWAVKQGIAAADRICIAGGSYGGYATLMGLVRHPELYRCGIAWVAVTDLIARLTAGWGNTLPDSVRHYQLHALVGDPMADREMLRAVSPVEQAERIKLPLLMGFGDVDRVVPIGHGERLHEALKKAGQNPEFVVYKDEGHGWALEKNRVDWAQRMEKFLARHLAAPAR